MRYTNAINEKVAVLGFSIPRLVRDKLVSGEINLDCTFGSHGVEARVRFTNTTLSHLSFSLAEAERVILSGGPEERSGSPVGPPFEGSARKTSYVGPAVDLRFSELSGGGGKGKRVPIAVPEDWDEDFSSGSSEDGEGGVTTAASPTKEEVIVRKVVAPATGVAVLPPMSLERATVLVETRSLDRNRKQGVLNLFPKVSLVEVDFKKQVDEHFQARAVCVAHAITSAKLVSRIASDPRYKIPGVKTINEWWSAADKELRFLALTTASKCERDRCDPGRLLSLPCPFRDAGFE